MPPKVNKVEVELKKLTKLDGNKTCADCPEKVRYSSVSFSLLPLLTIPPIRQQMPGYADLTNEDYVRALANKDADFESISRTTTPTTLCPTAAT